MADKKELIRLAGDLQGIVDSLLECAKEDSEDKEDDKEEEDSKFSKVSMPNKAGMIAMMLKKKLGK